MNYPVELTDKDWQVKKGKLAKLVKTGLKAELDKAEALKKAIDTAALTTEQLAPKTWDDLEKAKAKARAYYKDKVMPYAAQLKVIASVATKAQEKLAKLKMTDAAKAAGIIAKKADLLSVTCRSIDLDAEIEISRKRIQGIYDKAAKELAPSLTKFIKSVTTFVASDGTNQEWNDLVKQNGRSVSNSVRQLDAYNKEFWADLKKFQGFDTSTMKLSADDDKTKEIRKKLAKAALELVKKIEAFTPK
ncbi:hypothetical protein [Stagnihabitans tardus]|uniref:Uncharacterized protein n=1 Tax=Stagnihabitans tardus TaxID=2699202 RepID=A0AAE4Y7L6_9RHOB|nr:hypothetical protein [Stagnihabitans tardus]NBZ87387.1 hypothetical protein [Stagnihabitans tardus]